MSSDILLEEFEVLESIYPSELSRFYEEISETEIKIDVEPDDLLDGEGPVRFALGVKYTEGYPDCLPELSAELVEGDIEDDEVDQLLDDLRTMGKENLGMAMTFTLVSHLREQLTDFVRSRAERKRYEEAEKERLLLEAEEAKTRGTPVTPESFIIWKKKFDKETTGKKLKEQEDRLKGLAPKEREEYKKLQTRLTGRQLFERKDWDISEDSLLEEEGTSVDVSQYERTAEEEEEEDRVRFSDSE